MKRGGRDVGMGEKRLRVTEDKKLGSVLIAYILKKSSRRRRPKDGRIFSVQEYFILINSHSSKAIMPLRRKTDSERECTDFRKNRRPNPEKESRDKLLFKRSRRVLNRAIAEPIYYYRFFDY